MRVFVHALPTRKHSLMLTHSRSLYYFMSMLTCLHFVMYDTLGHHFPSSFDPTQDGGRLTFDRHWRLPFGALTLASLLLMMETIHFLCIYHHTFSLFLSLSLSLYVADFIWNRICFRLRNM